MQGPPALMGAMARTLSPASLRERAGATVSVSTNRRKGWRSSGPRYLGPSKSVLGVDDPQYPRTTKQRGPFSHSPGHPDSERARRRGMEGGRAQKEEED
jgi:hypothetical protein